MLQALARLWRVAHFVLSDFLNLSLQQSDETASPLLGLYMAPAESPMAGPPPCPAPKPINRAAHKRPSLKKPDTASASAAASGKTIQFLSDTVADPGTVTKVPAGAAQAPDKAASEAIMISPFSNYTGNAEEKQVEQARIKALSRSFDKRQQSRKSHLEVVEEADKEGDSGEEGGYTAVASGQLQARCALLDGTRNVLPGFVCLLCSLTGSKNRIALTPDSPQ